MLACVARLLLFCDCQWIDRSSREASPLSIEEADCAFFDRATKQYLTSGDPSSPDVRSMREAMKVGGSEHAGHVGCTPLQSVASHQEPLTLYVAEAGIFFDA